MIRLLILADDFTGGLDTGVKFASRGISTCVITDPAADFTLEAASSEVLVVVVESRHMAPDAAYEAVSAAVRKGLEAGIPHIYKKTDSALRGNIGAELTAVLQASGERLLPFVPALPAMNRVTRGGIQWIDGVPVAESVFGRDPFEPVRESEVAKLIALQSTVSVLSAGPREPDRLDQAEGIAVLDAETEADLMQVGHAALKANALRISAGCAGFASVLPELLGLAVHAEAGVPVMRGGLFVLCGSVNPITQRQLDEAEKCGFVRIHILPEDKLDPDRFPDGKGRETLAAWKRGMEENPWMILDANDADPSNRDTAEKARESGMSTEEVRRRISASLGRILSAMTDTSAGRVLLITGGDTLLQSMNCMKVSRMIPLAEVFPGVVLNRVALHGKEWLLMTKSGGFGDTALLRNLKNLIEQQNAALCRDFTDEEEPR